jgi:hypothetical protein
MNPDLEMVGIDWLHPYPKVLAQSDDYFASHLNKDALTSF